MEFYIDPLKPTVRGSKNVLPVEVSFAIARRKRHTVYSMDTPDPHRFRDGMGAEALCVTLGVEPTPIK